MVFQIQPKQLLCCCYQNSQVLRASSRLSRKVRALLKVADSVSTRCKDCTLVHSSPDLLGEFRRWSCTVTLPFHPLESVGEASVFDTIVLLEAWRCQNRLRDYFLFHPSFAFSSTPVSAQTKLRSRSRICAYRCTVRRRGLSFSSVDFKVALSLDVALDSRYALSRSMSGIGEGDMSWNVMSSALSSSKVP